MIRDIVLQTGTVTHHRPGAYIEHNGFSPACLFCVEALDAALTIELGEAQALIAASDRVQASFDHKVDGACDCPYCTSDFEAIALHAAHTELTNFSLQNQVDGLLAERDKIGTMV